MTPASLFFFHQELVPPSKIPQCLRKPSEAKLVERHQQEGERRDRDHGPTLQRSKGEPSLKIKADPDKPNLVRSLWQQNPRLHSDQELDFHGGERENTSSSPPSLRSSLLPTSSSPPKISRKLHDSSSFSLSPLPSFSSSFLCPLPTSSFSSSLHPLPSSSSSSLRSLPSSLCSLSSPAGSRKGRVCCGVCGKSFYDKGTNVV